MLRWLLTLIIVALFVIFVISLLFTLFEFMLKVLRILVVVVPLVLVLLFLFKLRFIEYYSCTNELGEVFSLNIQEKGNIVHMKMKSKRVSMNTSCEPIQGKESTYKCRLKVADTKDNSGEVKGYLILEEEDKNLRLYPALELVRLTGEEFLGIFGLTKEDAWKIACRQAGGKILEDKLCVEDKAFATCEKKGLLASIVEIFR